jgi:hypothetical protein
MATQDSGIDFSIHNLPIEGLCLLVFSSICLLLDWYLLDTLLTVFDYCTLHDNKQEESMQSVEVVWPKKGYHVHTVILMALQSVVEH